MPVRYERVKVTKRLARLLLETNVEYNRNPKVFSKVPQYTADMNEGRWDTNTGETIKITGEIVDGEPTENSRLIDGQNRLIALKESTLSHLWFDFAFNVKEDAFEVIDTGSSRTFADVSKREGAGTERNVNGAVVRRVYLWDKGFRLTVGGLKGRAPTHKQLLELWRTDKEGFHAATMRGRDVAQAKMGQAGVAGAAFYLMSRIDKDAANAFFEAVLTGANLPPGHSALWLGKKLVRDRAELDSDEQMILWCKTWNMYRKDELVDRTVVPTGFRGRPYTNETFPVPE
jgi:hypothetical protein